MKITSRTGTSPSNAMSTLRRHATLTFLLTGALAGCTQDRTMAEVTVTRLGVRGGVAISPDGHLRLEIPAAALQADVDVTIAIDRSTLDGDNLSPIYRIGPSDLALAADAELAFQVRGELGDFDVDVADLGSGDATFLDGEFDESTMMLTARTRRPSAYSARRRSRLCVGLECGDPCGLGLRPRACNARGRCVLASSPLGCGPGFDGGGIPDVVFPVTDGPPVTEPDGGAWDPDAGPFRPDNGLGAGDAGPGLVFESEPNDDFTTGDQLEPVGTGTGLISTTNDVDMWAVDLPVAGTLTAVTYTQQFDPSVCIGIDTFLEVLDGATGGVVMQNDDAMNRIGCSRVSGPLPAGRYYVAVRTFNRQASTTRYYLDVHFLPGGGGADAGPFPVGDGGGFISPDAGAIVNGSESEPNDTQSTSNLLASPSATVVARLAANDVDVFAFDVFAPGTLTAYTYTQAGAPTVCSPPVDTVIEVASFTGAVARNDDDSVRSPCSAVSLMVLPGRYHISVTNFTGMANATPYFLDVRVQ